ncbi:MAG: bifunctional phosphopantothenoylcysteine decarboxylase/phosphopantothenate--cysteine ligase CoaBC [Selenomonas sp.]|uniref:bifunctional phosphopantothenoylcysteine decarboxylase/phosphopantothenate--cysteine ligase CoaBC n=1 Tax=Selenomonas sp. TaxID=2053611 RepID=UPI0025E6D84D|nr:bifunctional phosphopantothenoylcysteine decarboxylase/phosphopantothenate--cysteine ligase CoaBC [Selenomonas sp.]MCR5758082.1 bifunctional phosphopantothenoylcysteine decarboxylase/phosphopantothenate--cysteine ligase CoaBC [Selenomonas sp.]
MGSLAGKRIVLGVTGGIAAYKAVEIASRLRKAGAEVHVIMTREATEFVTELTFREITGQPVSVDMWQKVANFNVEHIALANLADVVLIAPATANILAKISVGIADDMLTTTVLATKAPIIMAPAMNTNMYENPVTQKNIGELKARGVQIIEPAAGHLACGIEGKGRLPEPVEIVAAVTAFMTGKQLLSGKKIIVTAGGTIEPLDPVRYLGNRSTGKMGYAIAQEAARQGAEVLLVSGPSNLPNPVGVRMVRIQTALEMQAAVQAEYTEADAVIMSAAVADYRPKTVAREKIKKSDGKLVFELERNPDILYGLGQQKGQQLLVGFAAETCHLEEYARKKLVKKNLDFIVANDVSAKDAGFAVDNNRVQLFFRNGDSEKYPLMSKQELAKIILNKIAERMS